VENASTWNASRDGGFRFLARRRASPILVSQIVGLLVLAQTHKTTWQIVKCVTFSEPPKGTSEALIYGAVKHLYEEQKVLGARNPRLSILPRIAWPTGSR